MALAQPPEPPSETEQLKRAFAEANNSPLEILHVVEKYLAQHPDSPLRRDLEVSAFRAAVTLKNDAATARWGEAALAALPFDIPLLAAVSHALLQLNTKATAERALIYARRGQDLVRQAQNGPPPTNVSPLKWRNDADNRLSRALTEEARANAILGHTEKAIASARRAFDLYPNAYSARTLAGCLEQAGKPEEAIQSLAGAFSMPDPEANRRRSCRRSRTPGRVATQGQRLRGGVRFAGPPSLRSRRRAAEDPRAQTAPGRTESRQD